MEKETKWSESPIHDKVRKWEGGQAASCAHDYENFIRKGRARYHCPKCNADISLAVVLIAECKNMEEQKG